MKIENMVLGPLANNVYLIEGPDGVVVVDPSCEPGRIVEALGERPVAAIVLTHAHWDHVGAAKALRDATGAPVVATSVDAPVIAGEQPFLTGSEFEPCPVDMVVEDGQRVDLGGLPWKVLVTPGHTPGSMCLYYAGEGSDEDASEGVDGNVGASADRPILVAGDTLFRGAHGRTDFKGGSQRDMLESLRRLAALPDETLVLPGHNELTTIGTEKLWIA